MMTTLQAGIAPARHCRAIGPSAVGLHPGLSPVAATRRIVRSDSATTRPRWATHVSIPNSWPGGGLAIKPRPLVAGIGRWGRSPRSRFQPQLPVVHQNCLLCTATNGRGFMGRPKISVVFVPRPVLGSSASSRPVVAADDVTPRTTCGFPRGAAQANGRQRTDRPPGGALAC